MKHQVIIVLTLLFGVAFSVSEAAAEGGLGPDIELVCPCKLDSGSSSYVKLTAGALNRGSATTNALTLRAYAHTENRYELADNTLLIAELSLSAGLEAGKTLASTEYILPYRRKTAGTYYVTFLLVQDNKIVDQTMMSEQITLTNVPSEAYTNLYFAEDPSYTIKDSVLTLNVPVIGNTASEDQAVEVQLLGTQTDEFFGQSYVTIGSVSSVTSVPAGGQSKATTVQFDDYPGSGELSTYPEEFNYFYLLVSEGTTSILLHSFDGEGTSYKTQSFAVEEVDFLTDTDGDGVADDNEKIAGTDPQLSSSTPGTSYVDVLIVYTPAVKEHYNGESGLLTRLDHLISYSNTALSDSGVKMKVRRVGDIGSGELAMDTSQDIETWLSAANDGTGVFSDLQTLRDQAGADLVVMFRRFDGKDTCGLAGLGGYPTQGLLERTTAVSANFIEFDECQDNTMIHEMGHNMGLAHSFAQNVTGTFEWARGHGVNDSFATIMAYGSQFNVSGELPYFSNPDVSLCKTSACGIAVGKAEAADAARSLNAVRFQVAAFTSATDADKDSDGVPDSEDKFPSDATETADNDGDGLGDNVDYDDDNDGMPDIWEIAQGHDPNTDDASSDADSDGQSNLEEYQARPKASQYLQTTSTSSAVTRLHILNRSDASQSFLGTLFNSDGAQMGPAYQSLGDAVSANGRLILSSSDLERIFSVDAWKGPAMLEVLGEGTFSLMAKLVSPSGLTSNTNCVRENRVLNIEGFDSSNNTFVRLINTNNNAIGSITGSLYDKDGGVIGTGNVELKSSMAPKQQVWINRSNFSSLVGEQWNGEALLEVNNIDGLKLLNLNFVNSETFFNFSCFEDETGGGIYLQTASTSANESLTHVVNTAETAQTFEATLYNGSGEQLGAAATTLHTGTVPAKGRLILSSGDIESLFGISAWSGPAMLEVTGSSTFELMTKLKSPSELISNTNCVRSNEVHNVEGSDSSAPSLVRLINTGTSSTGSITGTLIDKSGSLIGEADQQLVSSLAAKQQVWLNRNNLINIFGETWNGEAMLKVNGGDDLKLLNLNFINSETFFNFSCYEETQ